MIDKNKKVTLNTVKSLLNVFDKNDLLNIMDSLQTRTIDEVYNSITKNTIYQKDYDDVFIFLLHFIKACYVYEQQLVYINDPKFKNTKDYNNINKMMKDDFVVFVDKFVNDASGSVDYENGTVFYTFYGFKFSTERIKKHKTEYINIHKYLKQTYGEDIIKIMNNIRNASKNLETVNPDSLSRSRLLDIFEESENLDYIFSHYKDKNKILLNTEFIIRNHWNACIDEVYCYKGEYFVRVCIQSDKTDTYQNVKLDRFLTDGTTTVSVKMWDGYVDDNSNPIYTTVNAVFKEDQKTDLLRSILKQFQYDIKSN